MVDNIVIGYILFIGNNLFQLNVIYIFFFNNSLIFYGVSIILLNG